MPERLIFCYSSFLIASCSHRRKISHIEKKALHDDATNMRKHVLTTMLGRVCEILLGFELKNIFSGIIQSSYEPFAMGLHQHTRVHPICYVCVRERVSRTGENML